MKLVVVADAHLNRFSNYEIKYFIKFIQSLDPKQQALIILGDLFTSWCSFSKTHDITVRSTLNQLRNYREQGGYVGFVAGNKDIFFRSDINTPVGSSLPFQDIVSDYLLYETHTAKRLFLAHGDLVNQRDNYYLLLRKILKHPITYFFFRYLVTASALKWLLDRGASGLKKSNLKFKSHFPGEMWYDYVDKARSSTNCDLCVIGHFHPDETIRYSHKGLILTAWEKDRNYYEFDPELNWECKRFMA